MTKRIAFECYADLDLVGFLREDCGLTLRPFHAWGQGEVVKAVLVRGACELGIVDQDPMATHHGERAKAKVVKQTDNVELRSLGGRFLLVIKPDLERCFLRSMKVAQLESKLGRDFSEVHGALNVDRSVKHRVFRDELVALYEASKQRKLNTLVTDVHDTMQRLMK